MNGHEHNRSVAWVRLWGAIGATAFADSLAGWRAESALDLARFEVKRLATACYALSTTPKE